MAADGTGLVPRTLTLKERKREDIYCYRSPKLERTVEITGAPAFLQGLRFEFDSAVPVYCERPRKLPVGERAIELSFGISDARGAVSYCHVLSSNAKDLVTAQRLRRQREIVAAAAQAEIALELVDQAQLLGRSAEIGNYLRLLPDVQAARRLPELATLCDRILERYAVPGCLSAAQVIASLPNVEPSRVRCAVSHLLHAGQLTFERSGELTMNTPIRRAP